MIGAELHLDVKTVLWQETTARQEGSDSVAGNGDVPPAPVSRARRPTFPTGFRISRSQGSLPDRNLGCSTHQTMSPLVQPGLHSYHVCCKDQANLHSCFQAGFFCHFYNLIFNNNGLIFLNSLIFIAEIIILIDFFGINIAAIELW